MIVERVKTVHNNCLCENAVIKVGFFARKLYQMWVFSQNSLFYVTLELMDSWNTAEQNAAFRKLKIQNWYKVVIATLSDSEYFIDPRGEILSAFHMYVRAWVPVRVSVRVTACVGGLPSSGRGGWSAWPPAGWGWKGACPGQPAGSGSAWRGRWGGWSPRCSPASCETWTRTRDPS